MWPPVLTSTRPDPTKHPHNQPTIKVAHIHLDPTKASTIPMIFAEHLIIITFFSSFQFFWDLITLWKNTKWLNKEK
jgi:hypothetical protein